MEIRYLRTICGALLMLIGCYLGYKAFQGSNASFAFMCFAVAFFVPGGFLFSDISTLPFQKFVQKMLFGDSIKFTRQFSQIHSLLLREKTAEALAEVDEIMAQDTVADPNLYKLKMTILNDELNKPIEAMRVGGEFFRQREKFYEDDERLILYFSDLLVENGHIDQALTCLRRSYEYMENDRCRKAIANRLESLGQNK